MATPSKPQDRKAPAPTNAERELEFSEVEGHELLKPFSQIKSSDQARLMQRLRVAMQLVMAYAGEMGKGVA